MPSKGKPPPLAPCGVKGALSLPFVAVTAAGSSSLDSPPTGLVCSLGTRVAPQLSRGISRSGWFRALSWPVGYTGRAVTPAARALMLPTAGLHFGSAQRRGRRVRRSPQGHSSFACETNPSERRELLLSAAFVSQHCWGLLEFLNREPM